MEKPRPNAGSELRFAEALAEAAAVVNSSLQVEQVLDRILEQVTRVVPADTYNIMLVKGGEARIVRWRGYKSLGITDDAVSQVATPIQAYPTLRKMVETGDAIVIVDATASSEWVAKPSRIDHRAYLGAPIQVGDHTEGFINVNSSRPGQFSARDAERLKAFANHAAIALQNARLFEEARQHAQELERHVRERTEELQARTAWSEAILRSTSDGIIVTDRDGSIIQMNPVAKRWLEHSLPENDVLALRQAIEAAARADDQQQQIVELTGLDLELRAAPISGTGDAGSAVVVAAHDVSHLRALDRMRSQFISDVSHELRTPIASIRLYTSLIRTSTPDRWGTYLASLQEETARITSLIEGILRIARIEAGHVELTPRLTDLNLIVSAAGTSFEPLANAKGLRLVQQLTGDPIPVFVDAHWFSQVVNNLLQNAILYTQSGEIRLTTATDRTSARAWAVCSVEDSGMGIPADEQRHVFERFFRGEEARTRQVPGSGLGLAIAKGVTELHGGTINVSSAKSNGARFTVRLPLASDSA